MPPETILAEFARYGVIGLSFGVLLWATLRDKDRMAQEMNKDKRDLREAYLQVGEAVRDLREALNDRPCVKMNPIRHAEDLHG